MAILETSSTISHVAWARKLRMSHSAIWSIRQGRTYQEIWNSFHAHQRAIYEAAMMEQQLRATMSPAAAEILLGAPGRDFSSSLAARGRQIFELLGRGSNNEGQPCRT